MVEGSRAPGLGGLIVEAIETAHATIRELCRIQIELAQKAGKAKLPLVEKPSTFTLGKEVQGLGVREARRGLLRQGQGNPQSRP